MQAPHIHKAGQVLLACLPGHLFPALPALRLRVSPGVRIPRCQAVVVAAKVQAQGLALVAKRHLHMVLCLEIRCSQEQRLTHSRHMLGAPDLELRHYGSLLLRIATIGDQVQGGLDHIVILGGGQTLLMCAASQEYPCVVAHLVDGDMFVEAVEGQAGIEGCQRHAVQLKGDGPVAPGGSCEGQVPRPRPNVHQHLDRKLFVELCST